MTGMYRVNDSFMVFTLLPPLALVARTCGIVSFLMIVCLSQVGVCMCDWAHMGLGGGDKRVASPWEENPEKD